MSETKYKPILVIYLKGDLSLQYLDNVENSLDNNKEIKIYPKLVISNSEENKVEIISASKATVVEDIQKYVDEKYLKR